MQIMDESISKIDKPNLGLSRNINYILFSTILQYKDKTFQMIMNHNIIKPFEL